MVSSVKEHAWYDMLMDPGSDGIDDDKRMYQCFLYIRDPMNPSEEDSNHYALPLTISR
jgi:hypothetical protein